MGDEVQVASTIEEEEFPPLSAKRETNLGCAAYLLQAGWLMHKKSITTHFSFCAFVEGEGSFAC